jgi:Zn-dependent protease with chaperone function
MIMKQRGLYLALMMLLALLLPGYLEAQCSICTRTAQQLGEEPARGFNAGIIYLAMIPFLVLAYIGYRWYKDNRQP